MHARIASCELIVLIDSGSTHNFIIEKIVNQLQLPLVLIQPFEVKVANKFDNILVEIQGI